jgi:hypothetical protein
LPSPGVAHTATFIDSENLVVFGGMTRHPKLSAFDDIFVLNVVSKEWKQLEPAVVPPGGPGARLDHDACLVPTTLRRADGVSENYKKLTDGANLDQEHVNKASILVFGGMNIGAIHNDVYELVLEK